MMPGLWYVRNDISNVKCEVQLQGSAQSNVCDKELCLSLMQLASTWHIAMFFTQFMIWDSKPNAGCELDDAISNAIGTWPMQIITGNTLSGALRLYDNENNDSDDEKLQCADQLLCFPT